MFAPVRLALARANMFASVVSHIVRRWRTAPALDDEHSWMRRTLRRRIGSRRDLLRPALEGSRDGVTVLGRGALKTAGLRCLPAVRLIDAATGRIPQRLTSSGDRRLA